MAVQAAWAMLPSSWQNSRAATLSPLAARNTPTSAKYALQGPTCCLFSQDMSPAKPTSTEGRFLQHGSSYHLLCVQKLGADEVVDYHTERFDQKYAKDPFDAIVDTIGSTPPPFTLALLHSGACFFQVCNSNGILCRQLLVPKPESAEEGRLLRTPADRCLLTSPSITMHQQRSVTLPAAVGMLCCQ